MALFNPYQMVGSDKYAVLENERDIPSSENTYAIGSGPRPGYGVQPSSYGPGQGGVSYFGDAPPNPFGFAAVHPSMYGGSPGPATAPTTGPIGKLPPRTSALLGQPTNIADLLKPGLLPGVTPRPPGVGPQPPMGPVAPMPKPPPMGVMPFGPVPKPSPVDSYSDVPRPRRPVNWALDIAGN
jgi:hypothetical protein